MSVASALSNFMSSVYNFTLKSASALSSSSGKLKALIVGSDEAVEALLSDLLASDILEEAIVIGGRTIERRTISGAHDISFVEDDVTSALLRRDFNAKRFNVFLALTNKDEKNFLALALAKSRRIPIRVGLFRKREVARLTRELGLGIPVVKSEIAASLLRQVLLSFTEPAEISSTSILGYRLFAVTIAEGDAAARHKLGEMRFDEVDVHVLAVFDGVEFHTPSPEIELHPGCLLLVLARGPEFAHKIRGYGSA